MEHFKKIREYCKAVNIAPPKYEHFDVRTFEEKNATVIRKMPPFRHEFYAISLVMSGGGKTVLGPHTLTPENAVVFFNSPFQIHSWDIIPDWSGYYILFTQDFITQSAYFNNLLDEYHFFKLDKAIPFKIDNAEAQVLLKIYQNIYNEYHGNNHDKFVLIESYTLLLLNHVKRFFTHYVDPKEYNDRSRAADLNILTRFQTLIQISFYPEVRGNGNFHSPGYYAGKLNIHPNHLNAVVKKLTGETTTGHIKMHVLHLAKSYLTQTGMSIKEIAYTLHFDSPNSFITFFKKNTLQTPLTFRKEAIL